MEENREEMHAGPVMQINISVTNKGWESCSFLGTDNFTNKNVLIV
jgi:hypothetical protein